MARTPPELLADLFKAGASTEYDKLKEAADRKDENLASRGLSDSTIRAQVVTQMFVDCYERVLNYVVDQLNIPAEPIGIRTQDDADNLIRHFEHEAEATRARFQIKRNKRLATVLATWRAGDEYETKTGNLKARAAASLTLHLAANQNPQARAREDAWKRLALVVDGQLKSKSHDIDEVAKRHIHALGMRRPPPPEAYDADHVAGTLLKALKQRVDLVFQTYPEAVAQLRIEVDGLESVIRSHINSLVEEAVTANRALVADEFEKWGHDVPQATVDKAVDAARASAISQIELMLVELARPSRQRIEKPRPDLIADQVRGVDQVTKLQREAAAALAAAALKATKPAPGKGPGNWLRRVLGGLSTNPNRESRVRPVPAEVTVGPHIIPAAPLKRSWTEKFNSNVGGNIVGNVAGGLVVLVLTVGYGYRQHQRAMADDIRRESLQRLRPLLPLLVYVDGQAEKFLPPSCGTSPTYPVADAKCVGVLAQVVDSIVARRQILGFEEAVQADLYVLFGDRGVSLEQTGLNGLGMAMEGILGCSSGTNNSLRDCLREGASSVSEGRARIGELRDSLYSRLKRGY